MLILVIDSIDVVDVGVGSGIYLNMDSASIAILRLIMILTSAVLMPLPVTNEILVLVSILG